MSVLVRWLSMKAIIRSLILYLALAGSVLLAASPRQLLQEAQTAFNKGQYAKALSIISSIDVRRDFDNSDDMILALKIRSIAYGETNNLKHAQESIRELLFLKPDYKFDPFDTPELIVELAKREQHEIDQKNQQLASAKGPSLDLEPPLSSPSLSVPSLARPNLALPSLAAPSLLRPKLNLALKFLPLGLNHYFLGSDFKGTLYLSLQALSLAANITAYWWKQSYLEKYGLNQLTNPEHKTSFDRAQNLQFIFLGALVSSLAVSIIDALLSHEKSSAQKPSLEEISSQG